VRCRRKFIFRLYSVVYRKIGRRPLDNHDILVTKANKIRIMSIIRQTLACRANAKRSQGPTTEQGKAASSRSRLQLGFFSRDPLIPGEDSAEWDTFRSELLASLAPEGQAQKLLAERIVDSAWRLRRFPAAEAGISTTNLHQDEDWLTKIGRLEDLSEAPETALGRAFIHDCNNSGAFLKLARYETGIERALYRNLQALERLQAIRAKGVRKPPTAAREAKRRNDLAEDLTPTERAA
jgi:hypothetical protein